MARVEVVAGEDPICALRLGWDATRDDSRWRVVDAATGSLLSSAQIARIDTHGIAWHEFALSQPRIGRVVLMVSWETKWSEAGRVPLILLPDEWRPIGSVLLLSAPDALRGLESRRRTSARADDPRGILSERVDGGVSKRNAA